MDNDDHYDSVHDNENNGNIINNPYYGNESGDCDGNGTIRQSPFDSAIKVKVSENPYYQQNVDMSIPVEEN